MKRSENFHFRRIGGKLQLQIDNAAALKQVLALDEAFWALTSIDTDILRFDRKFLEFIDTDNNGKIRTDEVKDAINFVLEYLTDLSGVDKASPVLKLSAISADAPGGRDMISAAALILDHIGKSGSGEISIDDIRRDRGSIFWIRNNGDGVITPEKDLPAELASAMQMIMASGRTSKDLSGEMGVSIADIAAFSAAAAARMDYFREEKENPELRPFGDDTESALSLYTRVCGIIDDYFFNANARKFLSSEPERLARRDCVADPLATADVRKMLEASAAALNDGREVLDFGALLNPLYKADLLAFIKIPQIAEYVRSGELDSDSWQKIKALFAPRRSWLARKPADDGLEKFTFAELDALISAGHLAKLAELAQKDLESAGMVKGSSALLKLALCQNFILEFLNNFVSLSELFNPERHSRLQAGKLVLDGRHFTLAVAVNDIAEHKRIVKNSDICVIYVEISRGQPGALTKRKLAVGVTSGNMRNLFVGKHGLFFDAADGIYDAKIIDMVEQPVSIGEALKSPFYRFGEFIGKQTEKIMNTKNAEMQKAIGGTLNASIAPAAAKPAAPPAAPSNGMPMLLMGGGIGLAAIGSSIAIITRSLQNVSFLHIVFVLLGIVVIFGGPVVLISLIKLYRRNLSRFLESSGCAVNHPMRLSGKMGAIFTFDPVRPHGKTLKGDIVTLFAGDREKRLSKTAVFFIILLTIATGALCGFLTMHYLLNRDFDQKRGKTLKTVQTEKKEVKTAAAAVKAPTVTDKQINKK